MADAEIIDVARRTIGIFSFSIWITTLARKSRSSQEKTYRLSISYSGESIYSSRSFYFLQISIAEKLIKLRSLLIHKGQFSSNLLLRSR